MRRLICPSDYVPRLRASRGIGTAGRDSMSRPQNAGLILENPVSSQNAELVTMRSSKFTLRAGRTGCFAHLVSALRLAETLGVRESTPRSEGMMTREQDLPGVLQRSLP